MAQYLVLSAKGAEAIRGETKDGHALNPVPLLDGRYILGLGVLNDENHAALHDLLSKTATVEDIDSSVFPVRQSRRPQR